MGHKISGVLFDIGGVLVALDGVPSLAKWLGIEPQHDALDARWAMTIETAAVPGPLLAEYEAIPIAFEVTAVLADSTATRAARGPARMR